VENKNAPLGRAVIGGLLFATVSTLFFVPRFFSMVHSLVIVRLKLGSTIGSFRSRKANNVGQKQKYKCRNAPQFKAPWRETSRETYFARRVIVFLAVAGIVVFGILRRVRARNTVSTGNCGHAVHWSTFVSPQRTAPSRELVLPGNVEPYMTAPIYSRTSGYVKKWYVDIGARVKKGQLLAEIDTRRSTAAPAIAQQSRHSEANLRLAEITRIVTASCLKTSAVSSRMRHAIGTYNANNSIVQANQANVKAARNLAIV